MRYCRKTVMKKIHDNNKINYEGKITSTAEEPLLNETLPNQWKIVENLPYFKKCFSQIPESCDILKRFEVLLEVRGTLIGKR